MVASSNDCSSETAGIKLIAGALCLCKVPSAVSLSVMRFSAFGFFSS